MALYGKELWSLFGNAIVAADPMTRYQFQSLLARENGFSNVKVSVFSVLPLEIIIDWCKENTDIAPYFVARAINIFEESENGSKKPTNLFIELLEKFGYLNSLAGELSANLSSRSWSGSLVPYLESDKNALQSLLQHSNPYVRDWVQNYIAYLDKLIIYESSRDDEHDLGIY
ncbi:hypothetical protein AADEFJLK_01127 [Methylovulum psychrotolerans]|uniref:Uncharacterized protein n=2 Tax=Methylovulum psychrotolerans TaxID=1704499 RepID=A0A2S5CTG2_9GAMM|nr:hypothetical protein AADEFJLK_01127 [Methylovulum psychrotolerans]